MGALTSPALALLGRLWNRTEMHGSQVLDRELPVCWLLFTLVRSGLVSTLPASVPSCSLLHREACPPARHLPSLPAACCPARRQAHNKALNVQRSFRRQRCTPPAASSAAPAASTWHGAPEAESAPIEGETRRPNLASSQTGCAPSTWTSRGGIPGPASDLAHRRLITAIYPPTVCAARWHRLFTSPAHARLPCRRRRRRRHCHGLRDQVPRGLRRRRRV
jgi:hypothetical protein